MSLPPWLFLPFQTFSSVKTTTPRCVYPGWGAWQLGLSLAGERTACGALQERGGSWWNDRRRAWTQCSDFIFNLQAYTRKNTVHQLGNVKNVWHVDRVQKTALLQNIPDSGSLHNKFKRIVRVLSQLHIIQKAHVSVLSVYAAACFPITSARSLSCSTLRQGSAEIGLIENRL